jgi:transcriptional regulator with XRE-family HTH domain
MEGCPVSVMFFRALTGTELLYERMEMKTEIRYGKRIKEERQKRGWTQEHLAEVAGIAPRTIARIEKNEVQGLDSLMAIGAAFGMELRQLAQTFRIAEAKPLRSLLIRRAEDLHVTFSRAHHSGLHRTMLLPLRSDFEERAEELFDAIFSDLQYLSPDEPEMMRTWVECAKEPLQELRSMGMEIFSIQDCREVFVGETGNKRLMENWTTGYYLLVWEHSCFSVQSCIHRFNDKCAVAVGGLHDWLRQDQNFTEVDLYVFANELAVTAIKGIEPIYCSVCFPNGPTGEYLTEEYIQRISGLSGEEIRNLLGQLRASAERLRISTKSSTRN